MEFISYIFALLLSLPAAHSDAETWEEREARMMIVATAIDEATALATCTAQHAPTNDYTCEPIWKGSKKDLAVLLITKGWWESKFAKNVHEGDCKSWECDPKKSADGSIVHRARSSWQVQKTGYVKKDEWKKMKGATLEATTIAANVATRALSASYNRCGTIMGSLSGYGGVLSCTWSGVSNRLVFWKKLMARSSEETQKLIEVQKKAVRAKSTGAS